MVILGSNRIQNGDGLVLANLDPSGKWPLKWRERERSVFYHTLGCASDCPFNFLTTVLCTSGFRLTGSAYYSADHSRLCQVLL